MGDEYKIGTLTFDLNWFERYYMRIQIEGIRILYFFFLQRTGITNLTAQKKLFKTFKIIREIK